MSLDSQKQLLLTKGFIQECADNIDLLKKEVDSKQSLILELTNKLQYLQAKLDEKITGVSPAQQNQITNLEQTINQYQNLVESINNQVYEQTKQFQSLEANLESIKTQAQEKESKLGRERASHRVQLRKLVCEIERARAHETNFINKEKEFFEKQTQLMTQNAQFQDEIRRLKTRNKILQSKINKVNGYVPKLENSARKNTRLTNQLKQSQLENEVKNKQINKILNNLEKYKTSNRELLSYINSIQNTSDTFRNSIHMQANTLPIGFQTRIGSKNSTNLAIDLPEVVNEMNNTIMKQDKKINRLKNQIKRQSAGVIQPLTNDKRYFQSRANSLSIENTRHIANIQQSEMNKRRWLEIIKEQHAALVQVLQAIKPQPQ